MVNINNKNWDKLRFADIQKLLSGSDDENFFFEFKADDETPAKLIKEVSAFANTYGGYILLGINDDKTIGGCKKWTEQRIHVTIHDSITPIPNFDVKKFKSNGRVIFIIKIEEGTLPPYITNKGQVFERVSSGSFPVNQSSQLAQIYQKRVDQIAKIREKIELPTIDINHNFPNNIFAYLDFGFFVVCSERTNLQKNFYKMDFGQVADYIKSMSSEFSISQIGYSYLFTLGEMIARDDRGKQYPTGAGIHNFLEIMADGSVRGRVILTGEIDSTNVDITLIGYYLHIVFKNIYAMIFGDKFSKIFVHAHKYEKLTVLKQFVPFYRLGSMDIEEDKLYYTQYLLNHRRKYGNNLIVEGNRIPKAEYMLLDKKLFSDYNIKYNTENLLTELFVSEFFNLGYIDSPESKR